MISFRWRYLAALTLGLAGCSVRGAAAPLRFEYRQLHMGVQTRIVLYAPDSVTALSGARAAYARIAALDSILSDYRPDSELMRLSAASGGAPVRVSEPLFELLWRAQEAARLSDGAFDVTVGPLVRLWRDARRSGALPDSTALRRARESVGWRHLQLDSASRTAWLRRPGMQLDLGGIAKGYAADAALRVLRERGIRSALVEMGGDVAASDAPPGTRGWRVALADAPPELPELWLVNAAVSTSGDTEQFVEIDGVRYSHVVDPRTGVGLRDRLAATVLAPEGTVADMLSTLLTVTGAEQGQRLVAQHFPGATAWVRPVGRAGPP